MKAALIVILAACQMAACGSASGPPKFDITLDGKTTTLELKDGVILTSKGHAGDDQVWQEVTVNLATYPLAKMDDIGRSMDAPGEAVVQLALINKQGTNTDSPMEKVEFPSFDPDNKAAHFGTTYLKMNIDGKQKTKNPIDFQGVKWEGSVKFTEVSGDTVKGNVDLKYGDKIAIKGSFTAKVKGKDF